MKPAYFQKTLLEWYQQNKRDLPWRKTRDPYAIWVSEIMLQQTQVDTVIPYYKAWLKRFPDVKTLSTAREEVVLKAWQGLGYYRRARMLQKAAKEVCTQYEATIPSKAEELEKLPGIGKYTAGAIASIAFEEKVPVLDGNVIRILTRLFKIEEDVLENETIKALWEKAESLLPNQNIGDFNQALMELGATVCTPKNPDCNNCTFQKKCLALKYNKVLDLPFKSATQKIIKQKNYALIWNSKDKILLKKQTKGEKWEGLWVLPFSDSLVFFKKKFGLDRKDLKKCYSLSHGYTKYKIDLEAFKCSIENPNDNSGNGYEWVSVKKLKSIALPAPTKKYSLPHYEPKLCSLKQTFRIRFQRPYHH